MQEASHGLLYPASLGMCAFLNGMQQISMALAIEKCHESMRSATLQVAFFRPPFLAAMEIPSHPVRRSLLGLNKLMIHWGIKHSKG